jgi:hypothetical protein
VPHHHQTCCRLIPFPILPSHIPVLTQAYPIPDQQAFRPLSRPADCVAISSPSHANLASVSRLHRRDVLPGRRTLRCLQVSRRSEGDVAPEAIATLILTPVEKFKSSGLINCSPRCLYHKHAIDQCGFWGQKGHVTTEKTVYVGYTCPSHSNQSSTSSYSAAALSDSGYSSSRTTSYR